MIVSGPGRIALWTAQGTILQSPEKRTLHLGFKVLPSRFLNVLAEKVRGGLFTHFLARNSHGNNRVVGYTGTTEKKPEIFNLLKNIRKLEDGGLSHFPVGGLLVALMSPHLVDISGSEAKLNFSEETQQTYSCL